ncbi:unnamed protein product [Victoria cruziana]
MSARELACFWGSYLFGMDELLPNSSVSSPELSMQEGSGCVSVAGVDGGGYGDSAALGCYAESEREASMQMSLRNLTLDRIVCSSWPGNRGCLVTGELYDQQNHYYLPHRYGARATKKASSAGDLHIDSGSENSSAEQGHATVVRYSAEERRERILRYQSKRAKRNFNRKVEYECRKVLADGRRRIRGRFARNEGALKNQEEVNAQKDEDDMWVQLLREEDAKFTSQIANGVLGSPVTANHVPLTSSYGWDSALFLR